MHREWLARHVEGHGVGEFLVAAEQPQRLIGCLAPHPLDRLGQ
jgi:hypothetical protein